MKTSLIQWIMRVKRLRRLRQVKAVSTMIWCSSCSSGSASSRIRITARSSFPQTKSCQWPPVSSNSLMPNYRTSTARAMTRRCYSSYLKSILISNNKRAASLSQSPSGQKSYRRLPSSINRPAAHTIQRLKGMVNFSPTMRLRNG